MRKVELVADGDVVSYMFKGTPQIGRTLSWPDAWAAATAIWLDVPLVAHDRDLERVPGLRVLTLHEDWEARQEGSVVRAGGPLWLGERGLGHRRAEVCC